MDSFEGFGKVFVDGDSRVPEHREDESFVLQVVVVQSSASVSVWRTGLGLR